MVFRDFFVVVVARGALDQYFFFFFSRRETRLTGTKPKKPQRTDHLAEKEGEKKEKKKSYRTAISHVNGLRYDHVQPD